MKIDRLHARIDQVVKAANFLKQSVVYDRILLAKHMVRVVFGSSNSNVGYDPLTRNPTSTLKVTCLVRCRSFGKIKPYFASIQLVFEQNCGHVGSLLHAIFMPQSSFVLSVGLQLANHKPTL